MDPRPWRSVPAGRVSPHSKRRAPRSVDRLTCPEMAPPRPPPLRKGLDEAGEDVASYGRHADVRQRHERRLNLGLSVGRYLRSALHKRL